MNKTTQSRDGFTIVELLIVIVVIAILAAISIVAYNGIQNRANDSAVQNDLSDFAKLMKITAVDNDDAYLPGGAVRNVSGSGNASGDPIYLPNFVFEASRDSYDTSINNLYYCEGINPSSGNQAFLVTIKSKSGTIFRYSSVNQGIANLGSGASISVNTVCNNSDDPSLLQDGFTWSNGYSSSTWRDWIS